MKHRPDIDGLRAIAVIPVVLFHLGWGFPGGFVGVDIFFVISGFLISGILLRDLEQQRFSLVDFYDRRIRRIFPALAFMLFGVLAAAWWLYLPYEMEQLGKHLSHVSLFLSNYWLVGKAGDYWSPGAESFPMLHTWSLAVEEQFYIFMPVVLWVLYRFIRKHLLTGLITLFIASLAFCIYQSYTSNAHAFYLLPARSWELLAGALVFICVKDYPLPRSPKIQNVLGFCGLSLILASYFLLNGEQVFPGYRAIFPVLGAVLLIYSNSGTLNFTGHILSWKIFQAIGLISYSLYLWHWPAIVFAKAYRYPHELSLADGSLILFGSLLMAIISWRYVEQPFRHERFKRMPIRVIIVGTGMLIFFFGTSLIIRKTDGYPARFENRYSEEVYNLLKSDVLDKTGSSSYQTKELFAQGGKIETHGKSKVPKMVLLGDSHGAMLAPVISQIGQDLALTTAFLTQDGDTPYFGSDTPTNESIKQHILKWQPEVIIVTLRWDGFWGNPNPDELTRYHTLFQWLAENCSQLIVTLQNPTISDDNTRAAKILLNQIRDNNGLLPIIQEAEKGQEARKQTATFLSSLSIVNLSIMDLSKPLKDGDTIRYHENGLLYYRDDDHLNLRGALQLKGLLAESISKLIQ